MWSIDEFEKNYDGNVGEHIAIVGMTGRFPGASNLDEFWQNLRNGVESISFFSQQELADSRLDPALLSDPKYVGADGIIQGMDLFDAEFFGYTPREAELMDPQHRLFLECSWEAMESAGYDSESYDGRVGVYASANLSSYLIRNILANPELRATATSFHTMLGNDKDFVATRVSYKLNLTGPSFSVATLCSSSFVAIHLAAQSLLNYQCDLALAGSISLQVSPNEAFFYQEGGIGDPDGHCRAFDAQASGTVSGSGIGIVVLKRLEDALAEGDCIHAIIRATALNNDGAIKFSYTAPSVEGQAEVIAEALALADVDPETITYVEAHGTGTRLGDPIEVEALTRAFRAATAKKGFCAIGSVKTNIGHLVNAGGVASLIKTALAFAHKQIPASLNFNEPNPQIDFASSPFYVNTKLQPWQTNGFPRRAGVSSFGIGGTNVHMIVEEPPVIPSSDIARQWQLLLLSAKTATALQTQTENLVAHLQRAADINIADVAYTLQVGRRAFGHRRALLCRTTDEAIAALQTPDAADVWTCFQESRDRPVIFMFPGTNELFVQAGHALYQTEPVFQEQIDRCADLLQPYLQKDIRQWLYPQNHLTSGQVSPESPLVIQSALFALEYALATLWLSWGVKPQAMMGEGVGEYVAACVADVLTLPDALALLVMAVQAGESGYWSQSLTTQLAEITFQPAVIPYVSGLSGDWITEAQIQDREHWVRTLQSRSTADIGVLLQELENVLLEVGPSSHLSAAASKRQNEEGKPIVLSSLVAQDGASEAASLLTILAKLWLAGVRINWNSFHQHHHRRRMPLPTYPFEKRRYWVEPVQLMDLAQSGNDQPNLKQADIARWFYIPSWQRTMGPPVIREETAVAVWLIFVDEAGMGQLLAQQLLQMGKRPIIVQPGAAYRAHGEDTFTINPGNRADYATLLKELIGYGLYPQKIVHLWYVTTKDKVSLWSAADAQDRGFYSLLFLAQALGEVGFVNELSLDVVVSQLFDVTGHDPLWPEKATILGPGKVIPQEYPHLTCRFVDIALPSSANDVDDALVQRLWLELNADVTETAVAYRGRYRWAQTFTPVSLNEASESTSLLRPGGCYLILNGLHHIGVAQAQYLLQIDGVKLAITTDLDLPPRDMWPTYVQTHHDETSRQIQNVQQLEASGKVVLVLCVDETKSQEVETAVAQVEEQFGGLDGIIYNPTQFGRAPLSFIKETDRPVSEGQLQRLTAALPAISKAMAGRKLDFCLLTSSLSSILGGLGLAAYAGVSNFVDAFVQQANQTSVTPWIVVNWDSWQFAEADVQSLLQHERTPALAISPTEGQLALGHLFAVYDAPQIIVSIADLQARLRQWASNLQHDEGKKQVITFHDRPHLASPYVAPHDEIEQTLVEIWQKAIGVKPIGIRDSFFELGGDSLLAVQIVSQARESFNVDIPLGDMFEQPTVAFLANYIKTLHWVTQDPVTGSSPMNEEKREELEF